MTWVRLIAASVMTTATMLLYERHASVRHIECSPMLVKREKLVTMALRACRAQMPNIRKPSCCANLEHFGLG